MKKGREAAGFTTIEIVIVQALFGIVILGLVGLHLVALSAGAAAETSSIAANLARARMEELFSLPRERLLAQNGAEARRQIPPDRGRTYLVRTTIIAPDPARLDLTVEVRWELATAGGCTGAAALARCTASHPTYSRMLHTRVQAPGQPIAQP